MAIIVNMICMIFILNMYIYSLKSSLSAMMYYIIIIINECSLGQYFVSNWYARLDSPTWGVLRMVMMYFQVMQCLFSFSLSIILRESPGSEELVRMYLSLSCSTSSSLPMASHFCFAAISSCTSKTNPVTKGTKEVGIQTILANVHCMYAQLSQHKLLV